MPLSADATALERLAARRDLVERRLALVESRLTDVRDARKDWTDEEHDPEGFALTFEWQQAQGASTEHRAELDEVDAAEARVHSGTYGTCTVCQLEIPDAQLELLPTRTACVACVDRRR
ncbi:TraR/DksA C4-type zinc finger protein [soil metagenome]